LFGVEIDEDVVRRVLANHSRPTSGSDGPSWLTFLPHPTAASASSSMRRSKNREGVREK
jgi:hypothetical protein